MNKLFKIIEKTTDISVFIAGFCMFFVFVSVALNIFLRSSGHSIFGMVEITEFLMPWLCFLSIPAGLRAGREIEIDLLFQKFSSKTQNIVQMFTTIISVVLFVFIGVWSINMVIASYNFHWTTVELKMLIWPWQVCLPFGIFLYALEKAMFLIRTKRRK